MTNHLIDHQFTSPHTTGHGPSSRDETKPSSAYDTPKFGIGSAGESQIQVDAASNPVVNLLGANPLLGGHETTQNSFDWKAFMKEHIPGTPIPGEETKKTFSVDPDLKTYTGGFLKGALGIESKATEQPKEAQAFYSQEVAHGDLKTYTKGFIQGSFDIKKTFH